MSNINTFVYNMCYDHWVDLFILTIANKLEYVHDIIQIGRVSLYYCPVLTIICVKIFPTKTRLFRPPARIVRAPRSIVILTISFILYSFTLATSQLFSYLISFWLDFWYEETLKRCTGCGRSHVYILLPFLSYERSLSKPVCSYVSQTVTEIFERLVVNWGPLLGDNTCPAPKYKISFQWWLTWAEP